MSDTEPTADRYRRLGAAFADTVAAVPDDRWSSPSPCEDWTARDVVGHVVDTQGMFRKLVGREIEPGPDVAEDPLGAWTFARDQVQADLDDPELAAVEFDGFLGRRSFAQAVDQFLCFDLVVHRWDLAQAAGLEVEVPAEEVGRVLESAGAMGDAMRGPGAFGAEIEAPDGADEQTRMLAFLGRKAF
jgi:uncharacterized protein (TIGR03086 family)